MIIQAPPGIRNNNPGNIKLSKDKWQGLAEPQKDLVFFQFKAPEWGIRAIARILIEYQDDQGINTIKGIFARWAPPADRNDTAAYIADVSKRTGFWPEQILDLQTYASLFPLVKAIIQHENGVQPYSDSTINLGLKLAGIETPVPPLAASRTIKGSVAAGIGAIGNKAVDMAEPIAQAQDSLQPLIDYLPAAKWAFFGLTIIGAGIAIYARIDDNRRRVA